MWNLSYAVQNLLVKLPGIALAAIPGFSRMNERRMNERRMSSLLAFLWETRVKINTVVSNGASDDEATFIFCPNQWVMFTFLLCKGVVATVASAAGEFRLGRVRTLLRKAVVAPPLHWGYRGYLCFWLDGAYVWRSYWKLPEWLRIQAVPPTQWKDWKAERCRARKRSPPPYSHVG